MNVLSRNNVVIKGKGINPIIFAHGFGCDQNMWRFVVPAFEDDYKIILFDYVGAGLSDQSAYNTERYGTLQGYAKDILEIATETGLKNIVFVGHSVSAMIGVIALKMAPDLFKSLILVGPSPSYINENEYTGGFTKLQIEELLESLDNNHLGWSMAMGPVIMGNPDRKELGEELTNSFCRTNPEIAKQFARTTFLTDSRELLNDINLPVLILQCSSDVIAPETVGEYVHEKVKGSKLIVMEATGHCPNLSAPEETIAAIKSFL